MSTSNTPLGQRLRELGLRNDSSDNFSVQQSLRSLNGPTDMHALEYITECDTNLMCPICRSPFVDPVVLYDCDHCFCRNCLRQSWNVSEYTPGIPKGDCPTCRNTSKLLGRGAVSRILVNILDELIVKCPRNSDGCLKEVKRGDVQHHVETYCDFTWIECPSHDCRLPVRRKDADQCLHFGVTCIDCRETMHMASLENHWKSDCPDRRIHCDACQSPVFYREIDLHNKQTCPSISIACPGADYGCTYRSKRGAINQHTKHCTFATIAPFFESQRKRLDEQEEKHGILARKLQILEGGFESLRTMLETSRSETELGGSQLDTTVSEQEHELDSIMEDVLHLSESRSRSSPRRRHEHTTQRDTSLPSGEATDLSTAALGRQSRQDRSVQRRPRALDSANDLSMTSQSRPPYYGMSQAELQDWFREDPFIEPSAQDNPYASPVHHLLSLHENLRDEVSRIQAALHELDGRQSMTMLNENLRLKEEIAYLGGQVGGLSRQMGWLTSSRLQDRSRVGGPSSSSAGTSDGQAVAGPSQGAASMAVVSGSGDPRLGIGRRMTDEGRTKL